jgi:hypothetical protein
MRTKPEAEEREDNRLVAGKEEWAFPELALALAGTHSE